MNDPVIGLVSEVVRQEKIDEAACKCGHAHREHEPMPEVTPTSVGACTRRAECGCELFEPKEGRSPEPSIEKTCFQAEEIWERCRMLGLPGFGAEAAGVAVFVQMSSHSAPRIWAAIAKKNGTFSPEQTTWPSATVQEAARRLLFSLRMRAIHAAGLALSSREDVEELRTEMRKLVGMGDG